MIEYLPKEVMEVMPLLVERYKKRFETEDWMRLFFEEDFADLPTLSEETRLQIQFYCFRRIMSETPEVCVSYILRRVPASTAIMTEGIHRHHHELLVFLQYGIRNANFFRGLKQSEATMIISHLLRFMLFYTASLLTDIASPNDTAYPVMHDSVFILAELLEKQPTEGAADLAVEKLWAGPVALGKLYKRALDDIMGRPSEVTAITENWARLGLFIQCARVGLALGLPSIVEDFRGLTGSDSMDALFNSRVRGNLANTPTVKERMQGLFARYAIERPKRIQNSSPLTCLGCGGYDMLQAIIPGQRKFRVCSLYVLRD